MRAGEEEAPSGEGGKGGPSEPQEALASDKLCAVAGMRARRGHMLPCPAPPSHPAPAPPLLSAWPAPRGFGRRSRRWRRWRLCPWGSGTWARREAHKPNTKKNCAGKSGRTMNTPKRESLREAHPPLEPAGLPPLPGLYEGLPPRAVQLRPVMEHPAQSLLTPHHHQHQCYIIIGNKIRTRTSSRISTSTSISSSISSSITTSTSTSTSTSTISSTCPSSSGL